MQGITGLEALFLPSAAPEPLLCLSCPQGEQLHLPLQALGTAKGMLYLYCHNPPVVHRDLKSANICVTGSWEPKASRRQVQAPDSHDKGAEGTALPHTCI